MNTNFQIEKNVPMPEGRGRPSAYPWAEMQVNDSFFIEVDAASKTEVQNRTSASARMYRQKVGNGFKVATRSVDGGLRVWRVS